MKQQSAKAIRAEGAARETEIKEPSLRDDRVTR